MSRTREWEQRIADGYDVSERFWSKVDKSGDCWLWTGCLVGGEYGSIRSGSRHSVMVLAHRVSWILRSGMIPPGMQVDHKCFTKACVNPDHLRIVTNKQNREHLRGAQVDSKTGIRGVSPRGSGYAGRVVHNGKVLSRTLPTLAEAEAWVIAKRAEVFTHDDGVIA